MFNMAIFLYSTCVSQDLRHHHHHHHRVACPRMDVSISTSDPMQNALHRKTSAEMSLVARQANAKWISLGILNQLIGITEAILSRVV